MGRYQEGKSPSIGYLWPHHRAMARDLAAGMTPGELADKTGFSAGQISRIIQSPLFIAELNRIECGLELEAQTVHEDLQRMATKAVEILSENLHSENVKRGLKTKTAFDVLDRAGFGKKERPQLHLHAHAHEIRRVEDMSKEELYDEVIDLVEED